MTLNFVPYHPASHANMAPSTTPATARMPKPSSMTRTICCPSCRVGNGSRNSQKKKLPYMLAVDAPACLHSLAASLSARDMLAADSSYDARGCQAFGLLRAAVRPAP